MNISFAEGGRERILKQGAVLSGLESPPEQAEVLLDTLLCSVSALCNRRDIPESMEGTVSILLARLYQEGIARPVSTVKRGDTAITYVTGQPDVLSLLQPFVRLHTPERKRMWDA